MNRMTAGTQRAWRDVLVAHRGEPAHQPENSLPGFRTVLEAGARLLETDVQITLDGVPVLCHDASLRRMTGQDGIVSRTSFARIRSLSAGAPEVFGDRFGDYRIASLAELVALLLAWPDARCFVEIKEASLAAFSIDRVVDPILQVLDEAAAQCVLISFELAVLHHVRAHSTLPIGWVLPEWNETTRQLTIQAVPDYLFVNRRRLPTPRVPLWPGPWQWGVYTVNRAADVRSCLRRGFDLIETNEIRRLLAESAEGAAPDARPPDPRA